MSRSERWLAAVVVVLFAVAIALMVSQGVIFVDAHGRPMNVDLSGDCPRCYQPTFESFDRGRTFRCRSCGHAGPLEITR